MINSKFAKLIMNTLKSTSRNFIRSTDIDGAWTYAAGEMPGVLKSSEKLEVENGMVR